MPGTGLGRLVRWILGLSLCVCSLWCACPAEGEYGVFGFATKGLGVLPRIHDGDRIASARIVEGADKLVRPAAAPQVAAAAAAAAGGAGGGEASSPSEGT